MFPKASNDLHSPCSDTTSILRSAARCTAGSRRVSRWQDGIVTCMYCAPVCGVPILLPAGDLKVNDQVRLSSLTVDFLDFEILIIIIINIRACIRDLQGTQHRRDATYYFFEPSGRLKPQIVRKKTEA